MNLAFVVVLSAGIAGAQPEPVVTPPSPTAPAAAPSSPPAPTRAEVVSRGCEVLLRLQQETPGEWAYEGVYRVRGQIPIGYRIGGTAIVIEALCRAPGYESDAARQAAVRAGLSLLIEQRTHPLMSHTEYDGGYDVRAWAYIYALQTLSVVDRAGQLPPDLVSAAREARAWYLQALLATEIPSAGGWNYARPAGRATVSPPSPFMTAVAVDALLEARAVGEVVDEAVVQRALGVLERSRGPAGNVVYALAEGRGSSPSDRTPGAVGRMCAVESALLRAGRGSVRDARGAVDAFLVHWNWLDDRRAKAGTHTGPYAVAPYYFMFAHHAAARAIELLPQGERDEYRRRLSERLMSVRAEDGSWNDRVFPRSAAYGTALAILCLTQPGTSPGGTLPVQASPPGR
jgi:hypothetical protein